MNTKKPEQPVVFSTPDGINYAGLAGIKYHLRLQSKGLKSSGGAIRPQVAAMLGLKPRDSYEKFIAAVEDRMERLLADKRQSDAQAEKGK